MVDIAIAWDTAHGRGDWYADKGSLAIDPGGLRSAVLVSLFTDARASNDATLPGGGDDRRGWWADTYQANDTGSLLWLLARAKKAGNGAGYTGAVGNLTQRVEDTCRAALQWLLDDGVAKSVGVTARWLSASALGVRIVITKPSGASEAFDYSWAWDGI